MAETLFSSELKAINSDLDMLKQQRTQSKKILNKKLRAPISFKIREFRQVLSEIRVVMLDIIKMEKEFTDFNDKGEKEIKQLLDTLQHLVEQAVYWFENQEIGSGEALDSKINAAEKTKIIEESKQALKGIEVTQIDIMKNFRALLKKIEVLLAQHLGHNKNEDAMIDKLIFLVKKMIKQFKLMIKANIRSIRLIDNL